MLKAENPRFQLGLLVHVEVVPKIVCRNIVLLFNMLKGSLGENCFLIVVISSFRPSYSFTVVKYCSSHDIDFYNW